DQLIAVHVDDVARRRVHRMRSIDGLRPLLRYYLSGEKLRSPLSDLVVIVPSKTAPGAVGGAVRRGRYQRLRLVLVQKRARAACCEKRALEVCQPKSADVFLKRGRGVG